MGGDEFLRIDTFLFFSSSSLFVFSLSLLRGEYLDLYLLALSWRLEGKGDGTYERLFTVLHGSRGSHEGDS